MPHTALWGVHCCTLGLGAYGMGWLIVHWALGGECVASRYIVHLFLSNAGRVTLLDIGVGTSLVVGVTWTGLVVGDQAPLQVLMAP